MEKLEDLKLLVCSVKNCKNVPMIEIGIIDEKRKYLCFKHWEDLVRRWLKEVNYNE